MLKKLTNQTTVQKMRVAERTADITCSRTCYIACGADEQMYNFTYEENYYMYEG